MTLEKMLLIGSISTAFIGKKTHPLRNIKHAVINATIYSIHCNVGECDCLSELSGSDSVPLNNLMNLYRQKMFFFSPYLRLMNNLFR